MPKLQIIKRLGNPKPRKTIRARKPLKRKKAFRRNPAAPAQKFILRAITGDWKTGKNFKPLYWNGRAWVTGERKAKKYSKDDARKALATIQKPPGWFVVDGIAL